jgi:hypothetical protein
MTNGYTGKNLEVHQKTGFHNPDPSMPVVILDERGIPFYDSTLYENKPGMFNMPPGKYIVMSGRLHEMNSPVEYPLLPVKPVHRRKRANPEMFPVEFVNNPQHRATIDWFDKKIYFDNSLAEMPMPNLIYVLFHEFGHRFYGCECSGRSRCPKCKEAEEQCDRYAQNRMLERGYNPSQIGEAILGTLSAKQYNRKERVVDSTIAVNDLVYRPESQNYFDGDNCDDDGEYFRTDSLELMRATKDIPIFSEPGFFQSQPTTLHVRKKLYAGDLFSIADVHVYNGRKWLELTTSGVIPDDPSTYIQAGESEPLTSEQKSQVTKDVIGTTPGGSATMAVTKTLGSISDATEWIFTNPIKTALIAGVAYLLITQTLPKILTGK